VEQPSSGQKPRPTLTTFSTAMKKDSAYHVTSAIPIHTSTGTKTGVLDSGSGVTLIKKEPVEEISELKKPIPTTKLSQSSQGRKREISGVVDLHVHTEDRVRESKISRFNQEKETGDFSSRGSPTF